MSALPAPLRAARRVLFAHAHPDDEALATGALIADLAARGVDCYVLTATRGERGEIRPGAAAGHPITELRGRELAASCAALGVTAHAYLGDDARPYRDSGMRWVRPGLAGPAADRDRDALTARREAEAVADLTRAIRAWEVDAVVGYDDGGSYGHPDHVRMHHVTRAACAAVAVPLVQVRSESTYARTAADPPVPPPSAGTGTFVNLPHTLPALTRALASYASQIELAGPVELGHLRGVRIIHVGGQVQDIWCGLAPQDAPGRGQWGHSPQR